MTIAEAVDMLTRAATARGQRVRVEHSPVSETCYVELAHADSWTCRVRVSDHDRPGGRGRYPLEIRTSDTPAAVEELLASLWPEGQVQQGRDGRR